MRTVGFAAVVAACGLASAANAALITPGGFESTAGDSSNSIPFGSTIGNRYQQVYDASGFGGTDGIVSSVAFRLDEADRIQDLPPPGPTTPNGSFDLTLDLLVTLSHALVDSRTISSDLDGQVGVDATVVFDGIVNWSTTQQPGNGVNAFDLLIDFDDVFAYNGTGNLLLDLTIRNASTIPTQLAGGRWLDAHGFPCGCAPFGRAWSGGSFPGWNASYGLVSQFSIVPPTTSVPEPSTLLLLAGALLAVPLARARRARAVRFLLRLRRTIVRCIARSAISRIRRSRTRGSPARAAKCAAGANA
jgi:hypothetical protein